MATRWNSKHTGQKIDDTIDYVTNPNLLDNWYFGNPVNQRGKTEYTKQGTYCIDRWLIPGSSVPVKIVTGGISFNTIDQFTGEILPDGRYTLSILTSEGVLYYGSAKYTKGNSSTLIYGNGVVDSYLMGDATSEYHPRLRIQCIQGGNAITILAVKLELGSQQTLAHQDADGNWILNEIPDYGEQLRLCQRYQRKIYLYGLNASAVGSQSINFCLNDVFSDMRATPSLTLFGEQMDTVSSVTDGKIAVIPGGNKNTSWNISAGTTYDLLVINNSLIIKANVPSSAFTITPTGGLNYTLNAGKGVYVFADANL